MYINNTFPMFCVIASGKVVTKFYKQTPNYDLTFKLFSEVMFMVRQTKNTLKVLVYDIALTAKTFLYYKNLTTISKFETWSYRSLQVTRMIYIFSGGRQKSSGNNLERKVIWRPPEVLRGSVKNHWEFSSISESIKRNLLKINKNTEQSYSHNTS